MSDPGLMSCRVREEGPGIAGGQLPGALRTLSTPRSIPDSTAAFRSLIKSSGPAEAAADRENYRVGATAGTPPVEDEGPPADGVVVVDTGPPLAAVAMDIVAVGSTVEVAPDAVHAIMNRSITTNLRSDRMRMKFLIEDSYPQVGRWRRDLRKVYGDVGAKLVAVAEAFVRPLATMHAGFMHKLLGVAVGVVNLA